MKPGWTLASRIALTALTASCQTHQPAPTPAASSPEPNRLPGQFQLVNVPITTALDVYRSLVDKTLVISPEVQTNRALITVRPKGSPTKSEAAKSLEAALQTQAHLAITPLDQGRLDIRPANQ